MSKNKNQKADEALEDQFILRLPEDIAKEVRASIKAGNIHEKLSIQLNSDLQCGEVRMNNQVLKAQFVVLPTIVESYKTTDNFDLFKTADISQMLVCSRQPLVVGKKLLNADMDGDKENKSLNIDGAKNIPKKEEKFLWPHGITPPTKNIRKRRITKANKAKEAEAAEKEVLKEVETLLRMDNEAVRFEYEVVDEDGKPYEKSDDVKPDEKSIDKEEEELNELLQQPYEKSDDVKTLLRMDNEAVRFEYEVVDEDGKPFEKSDDVKPDEKSIDKEEEELNELLQQLLSS